MVAIPNPAAGGRVSFAYRAEASGRLEIRLWSFSGVAAMTISAEVTGGEVAVLRAEEGKLPPGVYFFQAVLRGAHGEKRTKISRLVVLP